MRIVSDVGREKLKKGERARERKATRLFVRTKRLIIGRQVTEGFKTYTQLSKLRTLENFVTCLTFT